MGMFDWVHVDRDEFVCSEGHSLRNEEFQTKDFDCVLGHVYVGHTLTTSPGVMDAAIDLGTFQSYFDIGCSCKQCPAFVQADTFNLVPAVVEFRIHFIASKILKIERISESTAEFIAREPGERWMGNCRGPMPYQDAAARHRDRKFYPWDPAPVVAPELVAAQLEFTEEREAERKRWAAKRAKK